jgi:hypothetical protein
MTVEPYRRSHISEWPQCFIDDACARRKAKDEIEIA